MDNEKSQDIRGSEDDAKLSIWFTRGTKKLIEIIRDNELDTTTKIGKETKKAIPIITFIYLGLLKKKTRACSIIILLRDCPVVSRMAFSLVLAL